MSVAHIVVGIFYCSPLHYDRLVTPRRVLAVICLVWIMSALISFLPIQLGWHRLSIPSSTGGSPQNSSVDVTQSSWINETSTTSLDDSQCVLDLSPVYAVVSSMISFYLPCLAMTFFYYRLHRYARRHAEVINRAAGYHSKPALVVDDVSVGGDRLTPRRAAVRCGGGGGVSDHKAAITLGVIMGVFLLCWVPFFTINVVAAFCRGCVPPLLFSAFTWLGYLNSTMNPVIYSVFNRQFRDAFKRVLHLRRRYGSVTGGDCSFYRGTEWEETPRGQPGTGRRRTDEGRLSARPSVSEAGINSILRTSSSCRDMAYGLHTSCL